MCNEAQEQILFSIHVPVYKTEQYLPQCVESILNQTYPYFELFLMDDGSPDSCPELCDSYEKQDGRVHALHQDNQGLLMARRNSLKYTTGDYCLFVDSDDWVAPDWLESIYHVVIAHKPDLLLYDWFMVNENRKERSTINLKSGVVYGDDGDKSDVYRLFLGGNSINSLALKAINTEIVGKELPFDFYQGMQQDEDVLQTMFPLEKAKRILYIDKALYYYRQHGSGICHDNSLKRFREICHSIDEKKAYGERIGELPKSKDIFCSYAFKIFCGMYVEMEKSELTFRQKKEVCRLIRDSQCYRTCAKESIRYANNWMDKLKFTLLYWHFDCMLFVLAYVRVLLNRLKGTV